MSSQSARNQIELPILGQDHRPAGKRRGRGRIRATVLILVHLVILAHIGHFWLKGRSVSPVEPSEAMYTLELGQVNAGAIFFALAIIATAVFGRFFCGWGCHIVALQDLCGYLLKRAGLKPKPLRSRLLALVPFGLAFYMFLWPTLKRLWLGQQHPGLSNHLLTESFWQTFPGPAVSILTFLVCGGLMVYLLGNKGFCTYACPYGAFFSVADRVAPGRIRVTEDCSQCGQCTANCTSNVQVHAEVRDFGMILDSGCMKCMDCVSVCPNQALYFGLKPAKDANNENSGTVHSESGARRSNRKSKTYSFSISEEIAGAMVAVASIYALRMLYDIPPLLLSVALGVITAYFFILLLRVFRCRDLRLQNFRLKSANRFTTAGFLFIGITAIWLAFNAHSFFVQYHRQAGSTHLNQVAVPWDVLLTGMAGESFDEQQKQHLATGKRHLDLSDRFGLLDVLEIKIGLAVANMMEGDMPTAETYLREAWQVRPAGVRDMLAEFLVSQNKLDEAAKVLEQP